MIKSLADTKAVDKVKAFEPAEGETSIPIDGTNYKFKFSRKWFRKRNQSTFSTFLPPKFTPDKPYNMIQIGVFEGADLIWQLQNTLCHPDSRVIAIDPWLETRKMTQETMNGVYDRARRHLKPWHEKINLIKGFSQEILPTLLNGTQIGGKHIAAGEWDLIVIDGDHNADPVYDDAMASHKLIRHEGWMLFDDVRNRVDKPNHVIHGIIGWLMEHGDEVDLAWANRHMNCYERKE